MDLRNAVLSILQFAFLRKALVCYTAAMSPTQYTRRYLVSLVALLMLVATVNVADKELLAPVADTVRAELGMRHLPQAPSRPGARPDEPDLPHGHGRRAERRQPDWR